ncbi:helix-turn-helix domain-containing protein [Hominiventricola aquisgranensis]|uniref:Helix-turn-helix transcriptional regulator n=1 Tax=Hominiventricola aquisgranensis TaxID=3133164 RepID=A0ABV1HYQ9_9FIRM
MKERIKKIRKELDLTQQKFADKLGVKRNTVGQWECGINAITDQVITSICREFNVNESWLRTGTGEMFNPSPSSAMDVLAAEYHLDQNAYVVVEKFLNLKPEYQKGVIEYFKAIAAALNSENMDDLSDLVPGSPEELEANYPPMDPDSTDRNIG